MPDILLILYRSIDRGKFIVLIHSKRNVKKFFFLIKFEFVRNLHDKSIYVTTLMNLTVFFLIDQGNFAYVDERGSSGPETNYIRHTIVNAFKSSVRASRQQNYNYAQNIFRTTKNRIEIVYTSHNVCYCCVYNVFN